MDLNKSKLLDKYQLLIADFNNVFHTNAVNRSALLTLHPEYEELRDLYKSLIFDHSEDQLIKNNYDAQFRSEMNKSLKINQASNYNYFFFFFLNGSHTSPIHLFANTSIVNKDNFPVQDYKAFAYLIADEQGVNFVEENKDFSNQTGFQLNLKDDKINSVEDLAKNFSKVLHCAMSLDQAYLRHYSKRLFYAPF